jgi:outer membrane lipoprotein carrier protein
MRKQIILTGALVGFVASAVLIGGAARADAPEQGGAPALEAAAVSSAHPAPCDQALADAAVARIQARYDGIRDLAGGFVQTSESVVLSGMSLAEAEATRGTVVFAKPGQMRWHYTQPEESYVISDGKTLWIYDVASAQANKLAVNSGYLAGAALQFLLGEGKLAESFVVTAKGCEGGRIELDLLPREAASYERLGLTADPVTDLIVDTTITDLFGNRTRIRFEGLELNKTPEAAQFSFTPPAGVDVIDLTSGF